MKHLDLCSGIGGFALAARWAGFETVQFVEIDKWCQKILKKHWPEVPCHDDLKTFDGKDYAGNIQLLTAGYPCQPFSNAGSRKGEEDERHLWPEVLRIIQSVRPRWIICENVDGHVRLGLDTVLSQMEASGYTVWPIIVPASAVAAPHNRSRIWIVGHAEHNGSLTSTLTGSVIETSNNHTQGQEEASQSEGASGREHNEDMANTNDSRCIHSEFKKFPAERGINALRKLSPSSSDVAYSNEQGLEGWQEAIFTEKKWPTHPGHNRENIGSERGDNQWSVEPNVGRVADGISRRMDRIKGLGNAVVPQIPYLIMETIKQYESSQPTKGIDL